MSARGRASRRDFNEAGIVEALRDLGVIVVFVSGEGAPDLLTYWRGKWLPVEVKRPRGKLKPAQKKLRDVAPFPVVESIDQALRLFGVTK